MPSSTELPTYELMHPVYLDIPMMASFLAYLEGGLAVDQEETRRDVDTRQRALRGAAKIRALFPNLLGAEASAEANTSRTDELAVELRVARHHTAASLFNILYAYLREDGKISDVVGVDQLGGLAPGRMVEVVGDYVGNPFEEFLGFISSFIPYYLEQQAEEDPGNASKPKQRAKRQTPPKSSARQTAEQAQVAELLEGLQELQKARQASTQTVIKLMSRLADEILKAPVHDLVVRTIEGLDAVLTVSSQFFSRETNEYLRAGTFRVVGKVTRIMSAGDSINLARRTVLNAAGPEVVDEMFTNEIAQQLAPNAGSVVDGPALQIIPMAIFI